MKKNKTTIGIFTYDFVPFIGGQGRHVYEFIQQSFQDTDSRIIVFSPTKNDVPNHVTIFESAKKHRLKNIYFSFLLQKDLLKIIKEYSLDIVHFHGGPGGLFLLQRLPVPTIYTCHHTYWQQSHYLKEQRWKKIFYHLEKISYHYADKIICVSQDTLQILKDRYGINESKLTYIPNGVRNITESIKRKKQNSTDLLYVGRIDKRKGVSFLISSIPLIQKYSPDVNLHIVGEGKDRVALESLANFQKLPITFHGFLSDEELNGLYQKIAIQIIPSVFEGFGIAALEGMQRKIPIIATNVDGLRSIIKNKENGILIPFGDQEQLALAVKKLLTDQSFRERITKKAYQDLARYNWQTIYQETHKIYENFS